MQQKKKEKEGHLKQLEAWVRQENVHGKQPYYFMRFIGNQYPLEFIRFMKMYRSGKLRIDKDMLDQFLLLFPL